MNTLSALLRVVARAAILVLVAPLAGCDEPPLPGVADAAAPTATATAARAPAPTAAASAEPKAQSVQLLHFTLTSGVKNREPVDELDAAAPGQRVYAHAAIRNRTGRSRRVSLVFRVGGEERSTVDLTIDESWSFRSWGYNTLRAGDTSGELTVELRDDEGGLLKTAKLPIKPAKPAK